MVRRSCVTWITKTLKMYKPISYRKRYTHDIMTVSWRHTHLAAQVWRQISSQHGGCMRWFGRRCAVGLRCTWCSPELRHHWRASTRCRPHSPSPGRSPPTSWKMRWRQRRDLKVGRDDKGVFTSWGGNLFWAPMCGGCGSRDAMVRTVCCPWSNLAILSFTFCSKSKKYNVLNLKTVMLWTTTSQNFDNSDDFTTGLKHGAGAQTLLTSLTTNDGQNPARRHKIWREAADNNNGSGLDTDWSER